MIKPSQENLHTVKLLTHSLNNYIPEGVIAKIVDTDFDWPDEPKYPLYVAAKGFTPDWVSTEGVEFL